LTVGMVQNAVSKIRTSFYDKYNTDMKGTFSYKYTSWKLEALLSLDYRLHFLDGRCKE